MLKLRATFSADLFPNHIQRPNAFEPSHAFDPSCAL